MSYNIYQEVKMTNNFIELAKRESDRWENICLHSHFFYEIIFVLQGRCEYIIADRQYNVGQGNIVLIPPGIMHQVIFSEEQELSYERFVLWINKDFIEGFKQIDSQILYAFEKCMIKNNYVLKPSEATAKGLELGLVQFYEEMGNEKLNKEICSITLCMGLIVHINRTYYNLEIKGITDHKDTLLGDMLSYIDAHLNTKISIAEIAKVLHVSPSTISHMCKQKLNVSLYQFVIQRRLILAKNNILAGIDISKAWENLGFADYSAFFRAFKRQYGMSPTEFRKQHL